MPFLAALAPVFVALGASAAAAASLSVAVISSLIEIGANLLIGAVSKLFKHAPSVTGNSGSLLAVREPISFRRIIYGGIRVGSIITDMALTGTNNEYLHMILTIAGHEVDTLGVADPSIHRAIYLDGTVVELRLEGTTWHPVPGNKYRAHMLVEFDLGDPTNSSQPFPSFHSDASAHWTANHRQQGCAKVHLRLVWDATLFPSGIPQSIAFNVFGKKVFDPRTSTTAFSSNPALCVRDFLTDTQYGMGVDAATIDDASVIAAANICDEAVNLKAGGTQPRYTCDGTFDSSIPRGQALASMLASMAGFINAPGDKWRIFAGAYTDPVMSLSDSDLRGPIKWDARVSRRDLANAVTGTFSGPENAWQPSDFPPYESATYLTEDGGDYIAQDITLDFTVNHVRAQRLAKIHLEKIRRQNQLVLPCSLAAYPLEPGDVIEFTHSRFGWTNKTFIVNNTSLAVGGNNDNITLGVDLTLTAIDSSVYAWDETTDEGAFTAPATTTLPDIGTVQAPTGLSLSNVEVTRADGVKTLQIKAAWTPPTDTHVINGGKVNVWIRDKVRNLSVAATTRPWDFVAGGLNTSFQYDQPTPGTAPIKINVLAGDVITLAYVSGTATYAGGSGSFNAAGHSPQDAGNYPSEVAALGTTAGTLALIATFVDELGTILSSSDIHNVGNGPATITAPANTTLLYLGVNDIALADNTGAFVISIVGGQDGWRLVGAADGADTSFYIPGVTDGSHYDVKIVAQNSYGSLSPGDEVDDFTATASTITFAGSAITNDSAVAGSSVKDALNRLLLFQTDPYGATIITDSPVAYYRQDDTNATMADTSGHARNGTYTASPTQSVASLIARSTNTATTFNGSTQYGEGDVGTLDVTAGNYSIEFAIKMAALPGATAQPVSWRASSNTGNEAMGIQILTSGKVRVFWFVSGSYTFVESATALSSGTKYILVLSVSAGVWILYVNNASFATGTMSSPNGWNAATTVRVGSGVNVGSWTFTEGFSGTVDEVAAYNTALTAGQVAAHFVASGN